MHDAVTDWQELSALYEKADQLTGAALEAWLATLRDPPHPLLEPLLQMLGARSEIRGNGFLDALPPLTLAARGSPAAAGAAGDVPTVEWQSGAHIGPYRLEQRLGSGGMAEVWRARRDDGAFQRTVAIKLLFRHVGGPRQQETFAQRFSRERDILATLHHPNIAALHDAGVTPSGQPWLALEYVEGEALTSWCDKAQLGVRARVELYLQVLLAVQHAHANLVIHRDLKPANILVTTEAQVRLLDFGIAKLMEAGGDALADTELTRHAGRMMTVRYASPEQLTGQPLTTACDVYSLGVVLYELLCGQLPYEPKVDSPAQIEQAILEVEPRPPSRRAFTSAAASARGNGDGTALRRSLGNELDAVVLRALAKRPAQRYPSVEALRVELERWLAGEPVHARAPTGAYRLRKFVGRHVLGVSLGAGAALALVVVATVAVWLGFQARQESARATAARDFMMGMFKQADSDKSHGADMTARQLLDRGRDDVLTRLKGQPQLQADLLEGIAGIQSSMGENTKADVTLEQLAKLYRDTGKPRQAELALAKRAEVALRMGRIELAESLIAEAVTGKRGVEDPPELMVTVELTRGWVALWRGNAALAGQRFASALETAEKAFGRNTPRVMDALVGLVQSEAGLRRYDAAVALQHDLASRQAKVVGVTPRDLIELDVGEAELLQKAGRFQEVVRRTDDALPQCRSVLGEANAMCRRLVYVRAHAQSNRGVADTDGALIEALRTMANDASSPGLQLLSSLTLFRILSQQNALGRYPDVVARVHLLLAPQAAAALAPARRELALQQLAADALRHGRPAEAGQWLAKALELRPPGGEMALGQATASGTSMLVAITMLAQDRPAEALATMQSALEGQAEALGASHPLVMLYSLNLAHALAALNRKAEALAVVDRAQPVLKQALGEESLNYQRIVGLREALLIVSSRSLPSAQRDAEHLFHPGRSRPSGSIDFFN